MAAASSITSLFQSLGVVKRPPRGVTSFTNTFRVTNKDLVLSAPQSREHLTSLYDDRYTKDSKALLQELFKNDPDVSAAVGAYLTLADTKPMMLVRDVNGQIDANATATLNQLVKALTSPTDYTQGFQLRNNLQTMCQELRYMLLLRGGVAAELVFDKSLIPQRLQQVDINSLRWYEKEPGVYKPRQIVAGLVSNNNTPGVDLDIPSFFVAFHRRDPTQIYVNSDFVSVINTVAARQQVINDLYRIMQVTGYPRIALKVMEEVLLKNAPADIKADPLALQTWAQNQLGTVADSFSDLRADQAFAHFDAIEPSVINEKNPGASVDIKNVIDVLNAQNQAALKTMATVIGRGTGSTQVASAEVRIAAMLADQLNVPVMQLLNQAFTFMLNSWGIAGFVEVHFPPAELRPDLELEPQRVLKQSRLLEDLSLGLITDEEYHLQMYGRLPPVGAPVLSGTGFNNQAAATVNTDNVSPNANGGSLGNSLTPPGSKAAKDNKVRNAILSLVQ